ncbi:hypothetical protein [Streptomyces odontomachi]|uniref:hypothetical protein n=1 Tax=Streptomyces odontomachi TaxID=2944940 RepID=UPI0035A8C049
MPGSTGTESPEGPAPGAPAAREGVREPSATEERWGAGAAEEPASGETAAEQPAAEPATEKPVAEYDPAAPAPLGLERTPTGHAEVDAQLQRLADADHLATDGHVEVYEDVHRGLRDALTALDTRPGPPAPPPRHGGSNTRS